MRLIGIVILLVAIATAFLGQSPSEGNLCDLIGPPIQRLFPTADVTRRDGSPTECHLSFRADPDTDTVVDILKYDSAMESREEFRSDYRFIIPSFDRRRWSIKIKSASYWDDSKAIRRNRPEHAMFLRSGKYTITLLASRYQDIETIETALRKVDFPE